MTFDKVKIGRQFRYLGGAWKKVAGGKASLQSSHLTYLSKVEDDAEVELIPESEEQRNEK